MKGNRSEKRARVAPPGLVRVPVFGGVAWWLSPSVLRALKWRQGLLFGPEADVDQDGRKVKR